MDSSTASGGPRAGRREWIGLAIIALACLVYTMDLTVLHLAVPSLSADLEPSSAQLLWIVDVYGFMVAGCLITMGTVGDRIGRRKLLLIGAAAFSFVSILAAFSTSAHMLIACRALQGIAGATLAPSTLSLIFVMFKDSRQRSIAIGVWIAGFSAGSGVGPVVGGLLLEHFWWGSVFLLALPVMALILTVGPKVLPEYRDANAGRLDLPSAVLSLTSILAVIFGLTESAQSGFGTVPAASMLLGLVAGSAFVRRQLALSDPLIDVRLFRHLPFSASLCANMLGIFIASGYLLFVAQYLQLVRGLSPLRAGLWSIPPAVGFIVGSTVAPRILVRIRPAAVIGAGLGMGALGLAILTQVRSPADLTMVILGSVVISLGLTPAFTATTDLVVGAAPPERAGAASGISETGGELGGALGIAVLGSIGSAIYRSHLPGLLPPGLPKQSEALVRDTLGAAVDVAGRLPQRLGAAVVEGSRAAFIEGMRVSLAVAAILAICVGAVAATMLRHIRSGAEQAPAAGTAHDSPIPPPGVDAIPFETAVTEV